MRTIQITIFLDDDEILWIAMVSDTARDIDATITLDAVTDDEAKQAVQKRVGLTVDHWLPGPECWDGVARASEEQSISHLADDPGASSPDIEATPRIRSYHKNLLGDNPPCAVRRCDRPAKSKDLCSSHYNRWLFHGRPDLAAWIKRAKPIAERHPSNHAAKTC